MKNFTDLPRRRRTFVKRPTFSRSFRRTTIPAVRSKQEPSMCDYSLHNVAARPAKVGDKLVSTRFTNSLTRGFAAVGEPNVSVCLPLGTELAFETDVRYETVIGFLPKKKLTERVARFRYVNNGNPH